MPHGSAHNSLPVDVIYPRDVNQGEAPVSPNDARYAWHFLAEGDSWFTLAAIPSSSLLLELRLAKWTQILNIAYPGDTLKHIGELASNRDLQIYLAKPNFNYAWDAIVLSGGGNDVIDAAPELIRKTPIDGADPSLPQSYVDTAALDVLLAVIQQGFTDIVALRDSAGSLSVGAPAFVHTYDYSTPRDAPSRFIGLVPIRGPWLFKAFAGSSIDIAMQQRIASHLTDSLHPNLMGYRKIAARISARINEVLAG